MYILSVVIICIILTVCTTFIATKFPEQSNIPSISVESFPSSKVQIPHSYIIECNEFSALNKALFDIVVPSSIYFKITPKYLIICTAKVITCNATNKYLVDNDQIEFLTFSPKPLKPYGVFIRYLHPFISV